MHFKVVIPINPNRKFKGRMLNKKEIELIYKNGTLLSDTIYYYCNHMDFNHYTIMYKQILYTYITTKKCNINVCIDKRYITKAIPKTKVYPNLFKSKDFHERLKYIL